MRIFQKFPSENTKCPVCGTNEDKPCCLIAIEGTQEGYNVQAQPTHVDCVNLWWNRTSNVFYQKFEVKQDDNDVHREESP